ncbi:MAG: BACON domain-containing protein [Bacteroidales bacterium]
MNMKHIIPVILLILTSSLWFSCKKAVEKTRAKSAIDKASLSFGNTQDSRTLLLTNEGEQALSFSLTENIGWLETGTTSGEVAGKMSEPISVSVDRSGLSQNEYTGEIVLSTSDKDYVIPVYLSVDMFLVTVINPVFTTINIEVDTGYGKMPDNRFSRRIAGGDSTQFAWFVAPDLFTFYAHTSGLYTDSTQLGLEMVWDEVYVVKETEPPRIFLNVADEYFFLQIINTFETLNPLYVNSGTQFEKVENIFIFQSIDPLPVGYYHALPNTIIRAFVFDGSNTTTWINGEQFDLPFTINQSITIENYLSDTLKSAQQKPSQLLNTPLPAISRDYGFVEDFSARPK